MEPVDSHPYWAATGAVTYRDPEGRGLVFAPFVYGMNEPGASLAEGKHGYPPACVVPPPSGRRRPQEDVAAIGRGSPGWV